MLTDEFHKQKSDRNEEIKGKPEVAMEPLSPLFGRKNGLSARLTDERKNLSGEVQPVERLAKKRKVAVERLKGG